MIEARRSSVTPRRPAGRRTGAKGSAAEAGVCRSAGWSAVKQAADSHDPREGAIIACGPMVEGALAFAVGLLLYKRQRKGFHLSKYILKRILNLIPLLLVVSILIFLMVRITPTDPVSSMLKGKKVTPETRQALEAKYNLDKSLPEQYRIWIRNIFRGDFGESFHYKQSVTKLIGERLPTTLQLVLMSSALALLIALPVGILSAVKMNRLTDRLLSLFTLICVSMPVFLMGLLLMLGFALKLQWFPVSGAGSSVAENFHYLALPSVALALNMVALISRITRSNMIEQLNAPYAQTAIAKGTPYRRIVLGHCLKNALIPVITVTSIQFGSMIVGAVLVENVFALGGVGALLIDGIKASDYPLVQSITLMMVTLFLVINLLVDVVYAWIDPRIRLS